MARIGVVDIGYFRGGELGELVVKELGVCTFTPYTLHSASYTSCVFAPPYEPAPHKPPIHHHHFDAPGVETRHGIAWWCGGVQLSELGPILNRALSHVARVYCKGDVTVAFVKLLLEDKRCEVRDLNRIFMPAYSLLPNNIHAPLVCSVLHPFWGECAVRKSSAYAAWLCDLHTVS